MNLLISFTRLGLPEISMLCDAHVHVGYFPRYGYEEPFYYSPRRIFSVLKRCGVEEFIFSSTNAVWDESGCAMHAEAKELLRLAGGNAHAFFWCTLEYFQRDPELSGLPDFYEGIKLHGGESPWLENQDCLTALLRIAQKQNWKIQIHTDKEKKYGTMMDYEPFCRDFQDLRFNFAHGNPGKLAGEIVRRNRNIWIDTAFVPEQTLLEWQADRDLRNRILCGSDLPAPQRHWDISLTGYCRELYRNTYALFGEKTAANFHHFLYGGD